MKMKTDMDEHPINQTHKEESDLKKNKKKQPNQKSYKNLTLNNQIKETEREGKRKTNN